VQTGKSWPMRIPYSICLFAVSLVNAGPVLAFDCTKAATKVEKAICVSPELIASDSEMAKAYASVRETSAADEKKMLALSQRRWIEQRENACSYAAEAELASCISKETNERSLYLQGAPESGPGAKSRLVPVFLAASWHCKDLRS
jgi:uncharacterized protein YecT (DUF1311 family)